MENQEPKDNTIPTTTNEIELNSSNAMGTNAKSTAATEGTLADDGSSEMVSGLPEGTPFNNQPENGKLDDDYHYQQLELDMTIAEGNTNTRINEEDAENSQRMSSRRELESGNSLATCIATATYGVETGSFRVEKTTTQPSLELSKKEEEEGKFTFLWQICFPFLFGGIGMAFAGILFEKWQTETFLTKMPEAIRLITALSGLKGNLEMTLASRLSAMAKTGQMDDRAQKWRVFYTNLAVDQALAIVFSMIASLLAIALQLIDGKEVEPANVLCLMLASTLTGTVTSLLLATLMITLTFAVHSLHWNPENFTAPIAAALGDITSLSTLIFFGTKLYPVRKTMAPWLITALVLLLCSSIFWMWLASREKRTRSVLKFGWIIMLFAMCLSSAGGYVLKKSVDQFRQISLFQPLINGIAGNLVAVQSMKISNHLFSKGQYGQLPENRLLTYLNPLRTFNCKERESQNALILLGLAVPGHLLFLYYILLFKLFEIGQENWMGLLTFVLLYLVAAIILVAFLLYICQILCRVFWIRGYVPDLNSIPLLTALGDLLGTALLLGAISANPWMVKEEGKTTTMKMNF